MSGQRTGEPKVATTTDSSMNSASLECIRCGLTSADTSGHCPATGVDPCAYPSAPRTSDASSEATSTPGDVQKQADDWTYIALTIGFNELAKQHEKLGEKVYFRLLRDGAHDEHVRRGGKPFVTGDEGVMTIEVPGGPPHVVFREQDIEGMRAVVAAHDAKKGSAP